MSETTPTCRDGEVLQPSASLTSRCSWCGRYDRCVPVLDDRMPTGLLRCPDPRCRHLALYQYVTRTGLFTYRKGR